MFHHQIHSTNPVVSHQMKATYLLNASDLLRGPSSWSVTGGYSTKFAKRRSCIVQSLQLPPSLRRSALRRLVRQDYWDIKIDWQALPANTPHPLSIYNPPLEAHVLWPHSQQAWTREGGRDKFRTVLSDYMSTRPDQSNDESDKW